MSARIRPSSIRAALSSSALGAALSPPFSRFACIAGLLGVELLLFSLWIDTHTLSGRGGFAGTLCQWVAPAAGAAVTAATAFVTFAILRYSKALREYAAESPRPGCSPAFLLGHFGVIGLFAWISNALFHPGAAGPSDALAYAWLISAALAVVLGAFVFLSPRLWVQILRGTGITWAYAVAMGLLAAAFSAYGSLLWTPSTRLTFGLVKFLLRFLVSDVISDPSQRIIGTPAFSVQIGATCSGVEGIGLILVFTGLWLWIFRRTCRFPHALVLLPAGVFIMWAINGVRIALLIAIGTAGASGIAAGGFHSQAGWIAFNAVAFGLAAIARRLPWLTAGNPAAGREGAPADANGAYLMPLLSALAAAMIARAASVQFEWAYPIVFAASALALWRYRSEYRRLNWQIGWSAGLLGGAAFLAWLTMDALAPRAGADSEAALALSAASLPARTAWIAIRALAAVTTVPLAEELAFRVFLIRRIVSPAFLSVERAQIRILPVVVASLASAVLYGGRWPAAVIAGLLYSSAWLRRGSAGDAVLAHVVCNALLALYVVLRGKWSLW
jgi:exosortase E/protease (VPEID-CTERM system)